MTDNRTITEAELDNAVQVFKQAWGAADQQGLTGSRSQAGITAALMSLGITVEEPPLAEPEGDVVVLDEDGDAWRRSGTKWVCGSARIPWDRVVAIYGPVTIYERKDAS